MARGGVSGDSEGEGPPSRAVYDKDPGHLWNRVHATLLVRTGPDGNAYGHDRLEPLLWEDSEYLLKGEQAHRAVAVLEEFLREKGETRSEDPVKRAVLQRDLWLVANWLAGKSDADAKRLLALIAEVIRRLALTSDRMTRLPDNYATAVASKRFAAKFDPEKPEHAYLPPNLFQPGGPWICVGRTDGPTAPTHLALVPHTSNADNRFTNSTFLVFMKLPAGRKAGLAFLGRLTRQKKPLIVREYDQDSGSFGPELLNPDAPQLPPGTELALVRRAMLIDASGRVTASPLTESVQLRVLRKAPGPIPRLLSDVTMPVNSPDLVKLMPAFEFQFRRADLFGRQGAGLRDVSAERDFITGFGPQRPRDAFQEDRSPAATTRPFPERAQHERIRQACYACHNSATVYRTMNFQRDWSPSEVLDDKSPPMYPVAAMGVKAVEEAAVKWRETQPDWQALRKLLQ